jgi:hypothetical protein
MSQKNRRLVQDPHAAKVQEDNDNMLRFYRTHPDHRVSTADTEYNKHRSY